MLAGQHQLPSHVIQRTHLLTQVLCVGLFEFLDAIRIPQRIEGVFGGARGGRKIANHDGLAIPNKGVLQDERQLAAAEGCVVFVLVEGTNALLQRQQGFVDLGAIEACLFVLVHHVGSTFTARQIDE